WLQPSLSTSIRIWLPISDLPLIPPLLWLSSSSSDTLFLISASSVTWPRPRLTMTMSATISDTRFLQKLQGRGFKRRKLVEMDWSDQRESLLVFGSVEETEGASKLGRSREGLRGAC
ncbi:hypothetical protein LINGRAHAP2_LOCUS25351, partial [Linum grandiflorum]